MIRKILVLSANPKNTSRLRLDEEVREIENGLQRSQHRKNFVLKCQWAIRYYDIRRAMLDVQPNIVHFCGHGEGEVGIAVENDTGQSQIINTEALTGLFELFAEHVECVILNACYSTVQAHAIARHIRYVIGMDKQIGDKAAIEFSMAFYDALGAGKSIEFAHRLGCNAIQIAGIPEHLSPVLLAKSRQKKTISPKSILPKVTGNSPDSEPVEKNLQKKKQSTIRSSKLKKFPRDDSFFMLIEDGPQFTNALRDELNRRTELNIIHDFFREEKTDYIDHYDPFEKYYDALSDYKNGFKRFLNNDETMWLLTVYPEEGRCYYDRKEEEENLQKLVAKDKFMICFESGQNIDNSNVILIETNHRDAMYNLIKHIAEHQLRNHPKIHVVFLPGPQRHSIVAKRRLIQYEFINKFLRAKTDFHDLLKENWENEYAHVWEPIIQCFTNVKILKITSLDFYQWNREVAKQMIKTNLTALNLRDEDFHTCFLCVNDEVALGVKDAIEENLSVDIAKTNTSLYGFDGIPEMVDCLKSGMQGATMKVRLDSFCKKVVQLVKQYKIEKAIRNRHFEILPCLIDSNTEC